MYIFNADRLVRLVGLHKQEGRVASRHDQCHTALFMCHVKHSNSSDVERYPNRININYARASNERRHSQRPSLPYRSPAMRAQTKQFIMLMPGLRRPVLLLPFTEATCWVLIWGVRIGFGTCFSIKVCYFISTCLLRALHASRHGLGCRCVHAQVVDHDTVVRSFVPNPSTKHLAKRVPICAIGFKSIASHLPPYSLPGFHFYVLWGLP